MSTQTRLSVAPPRQETTEQVEARRAADLAKVGRFIGHLQDKGYYGKITVHLQNGKLVELRTEQVLKVEEL